MLEIENVIFLVCITARSVFDLQYRFLTWLHLLTTKFTHKLADMCTLTRTLSGPWGSHMSVRKGLSSGSQILFLFFSFCVCVCLYLQQRQEDYETHKINLCSINVQVTMTLRAITQIHALYIYWISVCLCVCVCEQGPVKQMGTAAVLPRLFHEWIPNNKSILNAKMNTCKNCSTEALTHFLVLLYTGKHCWGILLSINPASILHDCCSKRSKLLRSESINLRTEEDFLN